MNSKKIDYLKILKWIVKKMNSMTECGHFHLFEKPYVCVLQEEENKEQCLYSLYSAFEDTNGCGIGSIIAAKTPCKYFNYLVKCIKEDHFEMCSGEEDIENWLIDTVCLPIEQLMVKADLEE